MRRLIVPASEAGRRLDKFLCRYLDTAPKSFVYRALRKKNIMLSGRRADGSEILQGGEEICLFFSDERLATLRRGEAGAEAASTAGIRKLYKAGAAGAHAGFGTSPRMSRQTEKDAAGQTNRSGAERGDLKDRQAGMPGHLIAPAMQMPEYLRIQRNLEDFCRVVYEDEQLIIADKRRGVLSQKAAASDYSLNEALLDYCRSGAGTGCLDNGVSIFTPSVCNRLDRNTTGLICFAKTYGASRVLAELFRERTVRKYYLAAVRGRVTENGNLRSWIRKDAANNTVSILDQEVRGAARVETRYALPEKDLLEREGFDSPFGSICGTEFTLLRVELLTGKTHQIRAHLAHAGHEILGDSKYGDRALCRSLKQQFGIASQLLHAYELELPEHLDEPLGYLAGKTFRAELPDYFLHLKQLS